MPVGTVGSTAGLRLACRQVGGTGRRPRSDRGSPSVTLRLNNGSGAEDTIFPQANQYQNMVENFGGAVLGAAPLAFPLESSRRNQRAIDMLFEAGGRP